MAIDFMNMFAPRGTPSALDALLSDDQRKLMNRNANLSAAAALLQAGGRSRQRVGLGQALGAALQAGQQGYQQARTGSLQELLLGEKLQESKDERQRNLDYLKLLEGTPAPAPAAPTVMPPMPAPQQGVQVFPLDGSPTSEANQPSLAGLLQQQAIDQAAAPATAPAAAPASANLTGGLNRDMRALLARTPRKEGMQFLLNQAQAAQEFGAPTAVTINGKPVMVQYNKQGQSRVVADAMPYEAAPESIRTLRALRLPETVEGLRQLDKPEASPSEVRILQATGQPVTMENVMKLRQSSATKVNVGGDKNLTPGQKKVDEKFADTYVEWQTGGGSDMVGNLAAIGSVLGKLESNQPLTGPMIGIQPDFVRAIVNPNATDALERVQEVVQRNLRIVLGGAFTEREGAQLITRAYNPSLLPATNAARLRKLFQQMSISAQQRQGMVDFFEENGTLQGYRGPRPNINDFYKALEGGADSTQRKPLTDIFGGPR
jgi:hypothetical protein